MYSAFPLILTHLCFMIICAQPNRLPSFEPFCQYTLSMLFKNFSTRLVLESFQTEWGSVHLHLCGHRTCEQRFGLF